MRHAVLLAQKKALGRLHDGTNLSPKANEELPICLPSRECVWGAHVAVCSLRRVSRHGPMRGDGQRPASREYVRVCVLLAGRSAMVFCIVCAVQCSAVQSSRWWVWRARRDM